MCAAKLMEALNDCVINFDSRVLLTDLINEYHLPLEEVSRTLEEYLKQQEKDGVKYEKRFVIHGTEADDSSKEVFKIVKGEVNLEQWLNKLKGAESALYSVEVEGGAKAPAEDLKPVTWFAVKLEDLQPRKKENKQHNGTLEKSNDTNAAVKVEIKPEIKPAKGLTGVFTKTKSNDNSDGTSAKVKKEAGSGNSKAAAIDKKVSTQSTKTKTTTEEDAAKKTPQKSADQKKVYPKDKKAAAAAANGQKGIGNFFAPKSKDAADTSNNPASDASRQKSPKKVNDFFKKQVEKPAGTKEKLKQKEKKANSSMQLFSEDEEEKEKIEEKLGNKKKVVEVQVESSDEEEELNKLRRKVEDADKKEAATSSRKRLRIEDSDDEEEDEEEEEPKQKQGKLEESAVAEIGDSPPKSETYLDEDGFVITVKSKKSHSKSNGPATTLQKTPTKADPKGSKPKQTPTAAAKTKQGNIMNFFKKK
ncbi:PREDICTED: ABC transporter F family member 4 [Rhagoletis zephyria]|uniref:ABC transporter F family member 4 n=1 Tax=Rhagoletis zephyria TaxID=28612 RepID=UPI0008114E86|nr:PREDICTED: ABC transporter F family member 4 [Rhagoletis zephyria]